MFKVPESFIAERKAMQAAAQAWVRMTPAERRDHAGFQAGQRLRAQLDKGAKGAGASARGGAASAAPALGLVSNATKGTQAPLVHSRTRREKFKLNRQSIRCKRLKCSVSHAARLLHRQAHMERAAQRWNLKFVTLTYDRADAWRPGHIRDFRQALDKWCRRRRIRCRFVWVAELQKRGAVHYHLVLWLPKGVFLPFLDDRGWWPHGSTNVQTAQSPIGYLVKYASKATPGSLHDFPKGARLFGVGGLTSENREEVRYLRAPFWVRDLLPGTADIRKVTGGYVDKHTGEYIASPWRVWIDPAGEAWVFRVDQPTETIQ